MLLGQHTTTISKSDQVTLPSILAGTLPKRVFITQGFDRNLLLIPDDIFETTYERIRGMNLADPKARLLLRMILGSAVETTIGPSGDVIIPKSLCEFASLEDTVTIIGQGSYLEIWNPGTWSKQESRIQDIEADPNRYCDINLTIG